MLEVGDTLGAVTKTLHQEMYELGRRGFSIGGSEGLMVDSESNKVSSSHP